MPEDRDQLFEQALARHLRSEGGGESLCLDPETLAAYHERTLSPEEVAFAKSHIVSCARCQEVLARLEATQEVGQLQGVTEQVPGEALVSAATSEAQHPPDMRSTESRRLAAASPNKIIAIPSKKYFSLRWAAPAGAIAAALLIWIGVREARIDIKPSIPAAQVAENGQQPATPTSKNDTGNLRQSELPKELEKQKSEAASAEILDQREKLPSLSLSPGLRDEKKDSSADRALGLEERLRGKREYSRKSPVAPKPGPSAAAAQAQAADAMQRSDLEIASGANQQVQVEVTAAAPVPVDLDKARGQTLPSAPPAKSAVTGAAAQPVPPPPPPPPAGAAGGAQAQSAGALVQNQALGNAEVSNRAVYNRAVSRLSLDIRIAAPGGKKIWSVGPGGQILHSKDSGRTWLQQFSGVSSNLTGGSAPSEKICWLAGAAGTLLRTTDGGNHWEVIRTPVSGDLGGVHASDAKHASVWDAPNRLSYETSDGGATWKPTSNE